MTKTDIIKLQQGITACGIETTGYLSQHYHLRLQQGITACGIETMLLVGLVRSISPKLQQGITACGIETLVIVFVISIFAIFVYLVATGHYRLRY